MKTNLTTGRNLVFGAVIFFLALIPQLAGAATACEEREALLQQAALYVGSDSGLAHLSAAVGTPPVTLFGPADPDRMCPFGYRDLIVQAKTDTCHACNPYPWQASQPTINCDKHYACMRDITTEDILEKALPVLQNIT